MTKQEMAQAQANSARCNQMQDLTNGSGIGFAPLKVFPTQIAHDDVKRVALDAALQFCGGANGTPAGGLIATARDIEAYLRGDKA